MDGGQFSRWLVVGVVAASACAGAVAAPREPEAPPATKPVVLRIEGQKETVTFSRFDEPGYPFTTYFPTDMPVETASSGEGDAARFVANFGDKKNPDALLHVFLFPEGTTEASARSLVRAVAKAPGIARPQPQSPRRHPWSVAEYSLQRKGHLGYVALGKHGKRWFHVMVQYPQEYADGMAPRVARILQELRWRDTGRGFTR